MNIFQSTKKARPLLGIFVGFCIGMFLPKYVIHSAGLIPTLLLLAFFLVFVYVNIYIHEFGHLVLGKLVGLPIARVLIGTGKEIIAFSFWGTQISITNNIQGGFTMPHNFGESSIKQRFAAFTIGGVLFQLFTVIIFASLFNRNPKSILTLNGLDIVGVFIWSNLLMILFTLIPMNIQYNGLMIPNDGLRLLQIPFMNQNRLNELLASGIANSGIIYMKNRDYQKAAECFQDAISKFPEQPISYINLSAAFIKLARFSEAIELLSDCKSLSYDKKYEPILFNNLAWAHLLTFQSDSLKLADEFSKISYKKFPDVRAFKGTRACVLIALGEATDGLKLLKTISDRKKRLDDTTNPPSSLLFQAYAYWQLGKIEDAEKIISTIDNTIVSNDNELNHLFTILNSRTNNFQLT